MNIPSIYKNSKNNFLFNNSIKFIALREKLLSSFDISPNIK